MKSEAQRMAMRLKRMRKAAGLSQEGLARKAGLSLGYIARLEIGRHDPTVSTVRKLAKALGVSVGELVR